MSIDSARQRPVTAQSRLGVPWLTVLPLAAVMAYADGFWMISMRGATGAIERSGGGFTSWWRESTIGLPIFVLAVLGALTLALRLFGPVQRNFRTVALIALLVAVSGTVVGVVETAASSAYDYYLQSGLLQMMESMRGLCNTSCLAQAQQATMDIQLKAVLYASGLILVTNVVLVGWLVGMYGGRLKVVVTRQHPAVGDGRSGTSGRAEDLRLLAVVGLLAAAHIHAAVIPGDLTQWLAESGLFLLLAAGEIAVAALLITRMSRATLLAAALISLGPLVVWLYSRAIGLPFGPEAGVPVAVGIPDVVACVLGVITLVAAVLLLRAGGRLQHRPATSVHVRALILVSVIAVTAIGLAGTAPSWFDFGGSGDLPETVMTH